MDGYDVVKTIVADPDIEFSFERWQFHTDNYEGMRNMYRSHCRLRSVLT